MHKIKRNAVARIYCMLAVPVFLLFALGHVSHAGETTKGKYAGEFMSTGGGGRALALGGAYVAVGRDASAVYWNAAGLSALNYPQFVFMHSDRFRGEVKYNFAALAIPFGHNASLGVGLIRLAVDDIPRTRLVRPDLALGEAYTDENGTLRLNTPYIDGTFSNAEYAVYLAYARKHSSRFAYGGSIKIVHKSADITAWGLGFDLSAQYRAGAHLLLGANLQDATTTIVAWESGRRELIVPTLKLGAAAPFESKLLKGTLMPVVDVDVRFEGRDFAAQVSAGEASIDFHAGFEFNYQQKFAFRFGSDAGRITAGAGLTLPQLAVDYAFSNHSDLRETHRISIQFTLRSEGMRRK